MILTRPNRKKFTRGNTDDFRKWLQHKRLLEEIERESDKPFVGDDDDWFTPDEPPPAKAPVADKPIRNFLPDYTPRQRKRGQTKVLMVDYLKQHGAATVRKLANKLNLEQTTVGYTVTHNPDLFVRVGQQANGAALWGLTGATPQPEQIKESQAQVLLRDQIKAYLMQHGPSTCAEIAQALGIDIIRIYGFFTKNSRKFKRVEQRKHKHGYATVWGLP